MTRLGLALLISFAAISAARPALGQESQIDFNGDTWSDGLIDLRSSDVVNTRRVDDGLSDSGLEVTIPKGQFRGIGALERFAGSVDEAWYRYHVKLVDFDANSTGKLPGLSGLYSSSAKGCIPSSPSRPGWSARGMFGAAGTYGAPKDEIPIGSYIYHLGQPRGCGEAFFWDDASLEPDRWYCIEGHVRMNTLGQRNGVVEGWLDGQPKFSKSDFEFRRATEAQIGIREMWLDVYFGGKRPTGSTLNLLIDEMEVSTAGRIGCHESFTNIVTVSGTGLASIATYQPTTGAWLLNRPAGSSFVSKPITTYSTLSDWATHLVGDFSGDGRADIASYHPANGSWWVSESGEYGTRTAHWGTYTTTEGWGAHVTGDFSGLGVTQIASYHQPTGTWWVSSPSSNPGPPSSRTIERAENWYGGFGGSLRGVAASQVQQELAGVTSRYDAFDVSLWDRFSTPSGWTRHLSGDFDGDGLDDIASYHASNGTWWVSRSVGDTFETQLWDSYSVGRGWSNQIAGDFNGDGRDDIANYHPGSGTWWISISTGNGFITTPWETFSTGTGWSAQISGDFNGDGMDDIANYHRPSGTWWVSISNGSSLEARQWGTFSTTTGWSNQVAGDFDGDGRDDIASYHAASATWWVNRSTGDGFTIGKWSE